MVGTKPGAGTDYLDRLALNVIPRTEVLPTGDPDVDTAVMDKLCQFRDRCHVAFVEWLQSGKL